MNRINIYRLFLSTFLTVMTICSAHGQLQVAGKPMGDFRMMKGVDMIYLLAPLDPLQIEAKIPVDQIHYLKPLEFAIERQLDLTPGKHGVWSREEGHRVWRVHIISPGAFSVGLIFEQYRLTRGVKLMVYDPEMNQIKGAYSALNNKSSGLFAVGHLPGDEVIIELQVPDGTEDFGELALKSISHAFLNYREHSTSSCAGEFGCSESCEIDVNCIEGADWQLEKRSVVRFYTSTQYCTGVLVNNTAYNGDPLLLTAKHCIDKQILASATVFDFNYESPGCFGEEGPLDMSISGAELLAMGDSIDFSLVRLSISPPDSFGVYFSGWNLAGNQPPVTTTIHHPQGDVKKISSDLAPPSSTTSPDQIPEEFDDILFFSFWWIKEWDSGSTEPGSSGSPLFNSSKEVIGLLSWGAARCGDSIGYDMENDRVIYSKSVNVDDYYTKLNIAWDYNEESDQSLNSWLDPGNSGQTSLGGYLPTSVKRPPLIPNRQFTVYPNPTKGTLWFTHSDEHPKQVDYSIVDLKGSIRLSGKASLPGPVVVDISSLDSGIFFLQLDTGTLREVHKVVISK